MDKKPIYILGVNSGENATAALLKNGEIIGCVSEERFRGIKNYCGIPYKSMFFLLKEAGISGKDLDLVGTTAKWRVPIFGNTEKINKTLILKFIKWLFSFVGKIRWQLEYHLPFFRFFSVRLHSFLFRMVGGYFTRR